MSTTCRALVAALGLVLAAPHPASAEPSLGRLFFTQDRRQALEQQRRSRNAPHEDEQVGVALDGSVTRSSGKRTLWINGAPRHDAALPPGIAAAPGGIQVRDSGGKSHRLQPGDTLNPANGETQSALPPEALSIRRQRP